jgi:hypothetical protein
VGRYSSVFEPVEELSQHPHRSKIQNECPKSRRPKACSKFNQLGIPTCIKLAEAMKEVGARAKKNDRRRWL